MATRGTIAIKNADGTITAVYSHWNNYPSWNGRLLTTHYKDEAKVRELLSHGDISALRQEVGVQHPFDNPNPYGSDEYREWEKQNGHMTKFYGRDRGEKDIEARNFDNVKAWVDDYSQEFQYLFDGDNWLVNAYQERDNAGNYVFDFVDHVLERERLEAEATG